MAFSYNKKNLANTTITGAITSSDTSITVDDATVFPSGYFYATLMPSSEMSTFSNSEIVLVTNISSNTLTIARGQKSTTARAFSAGAIITNGVYTEDLDFAQSVGKKIFSATWGGQGSPYYKITDDMLKVVPDEGTSIRAIFDTDYASGTAKLSINESTSGVATVSGSNITITDAENLAPVDVKFKGDTFQQTYSGINTAFLNQSLNTDQRHYTYTSETDADISATKNTVGGLFFAAFEAQVVSGHTYRIKATVGASSNAIQIYLYKDRTWGTSAGGRVYIGTGNVDVQTTPDYTGKMVIGVYFDGPANGTVYCKDFMFGENVQSSSSYEPYTGGIASPNPDYPQTIQTVTGEQTITISDGGSQSQTYTVDLSNKETLQFEQGTFTQEGRPIDSTARLRSPDFLKASPNTTYSVSFGSWTSGKTPNVSISYYATNIGDPARITFMNWTTATSEVSFTTPAQCEYIKFLVSWSDNTDINVSDVSNVLWGGPGRAIELCKIGTYQDYIYKSGSDWYIHKETNKMVLSGTETITKPFTNVFVVENLSGDWLKGSETVFYLCEKYYPVDAKPSNSAFNNLVADYNYAFDFSDDFSGKNARFKDTRYDNVDNYKAWLASNNVVIYYALATATDTQITDATLISQLNALAGNTLYAGTNNIVVTGGLDGILEVQYYRSGSGVNPVPIVNGAYVADDNTRNVAPVKAGIPYDLTYHSGNWYVMNMVKKATADDIDWTTFGSQVAYTDYVSFNSNVIINPNTKAYKILPGLVLLNFDIVVNIVAGLNTIGSATNKVISPSWGVGRMTRTPATQGTPPDVYSVVSVQALTTTNSDINIYTTANTVGTACAGSILLVVSD